MLTNFLRIVLSFFMFITVLIGCKPSNDGKYADSTLKILNKGFEEKDSLGLPYSWKYIPMKGYDVTLVSDIKHSGSYSLRVEGKSNEIPNKMNLTQLIPINISGLKRVKLSVYVKTYQLNGIVQLWFKALDSNNKEIDFGDSELFETIPNGTNEWQEIGLDVLIDKDIAQLKIGLYVQAEGTVWFDNLSITEYEQGRVQTNEDLVQFNKEFTEIVQNNSLYKDSISWESISQKLEELRKNLTTETDVTVLNNYVLQQLRRAGDNHSFIQSKVGSQKYTSDKMLHPKHEVQLMKNDIVYILVPSFISSNKTSMEEFASSLHNQIRNFDSTNNIKGWIVDLRENSGGNMYPMIAGLAPLLDTVTLGYFIMEKERMPWSHTANAMNINVGKPYQKKNKNAKIAVIIGPRTGSSGEITAISFIGQKQTRLFGELSAGYTTSNQMFNLSNGTNLFLATGYVTDRNNKKYTGKIVPDISLKSDAHQDSVLNIAKKWLLEM